MGQGVSQSCTVAIGGLVGGERRVRPRQFLTGLGEPHSVVAKNDRAAILGMAPSLKLVVFSSTSWMSTFWEWGTRLPGRQITGEVGLGAPCSAATAAGIGRDDRAP